MLLIQYRRPCKNTFYVFEYLYAIGINPIQLLACKPIYIVNKDHERESQKGGRYYTENRKSFIRKRKHK